MHQCLIEIFVGIKIQIATKYLGRWFFRGRYFSQWRLVL